MYIKLTIGERLKDLRVEHHLTLEELSEKTDISRSALSKYESDDFKDISPFSIVKLSEFYGVSTDYLMGVSEEKNHPNTALDELHLSDNAIDALKNANFNHRLLSEMLCHSEFQKFMLDAEIYVDRLADMIINDMNTYLAFFRNQISTDIKSPDVYARTLEAAQVSETDYFKHVLTDDIMKVLSDIRESHKDDKTTADTNSPSADAVKQLIDALSFEGSETEKKMRAYLRSLGIDYDAVTFEELVVLDRIFKKSKLLSKSGSQRGKTVQKKFPGR